MLFVFFGSQILLFLFCFQSSNVERTWWMLSRKRVVPSALIYISTFCYYILYYPLKLTPNWQLQECILFSKKSLTTTSIIRIDFRCSYKNTFSLQMGWPYKRMTSVSCFYFLSFTDIAEDRTGIYLRKCRFVYEKNLSFLIVVIVIKM